MVIVDIFRKPDSDISEVVMKRRQQDAQAKQLSIALQRRDSKSPGLGS